jgi:hypothetical protein
LASASASASIRVSDSAAICSRICLAPPGPLRRDVGPRQIEQVAQVRQHLAVEAPHGAVGPRLAVLVRAQVVADQEAHGAAGVAIEHQALRDLVEHARADLGVAVEVDALSA